MREASVVTLGVLACQIKKAFGRSLKKVALPWWCCMSDPAKEVSLSGKRAFSKFSQMSRTSRSSKFCSSALIHGVAANLKLKEEDVQESTDGRKRILRGAILESGSSIVLLAPFSQWTRRQPPKFYSSDELKVLLTKAVWKHCASTKASVAWRVINWHATCARVTAFRISCRII